MVVGAPRPGRWRGSSVTSRGEELGALSPGSCLSFISCKGDENSPRVCSQVCICSVIQFRNT